LVESFVVLMLASGAKHSRQAPDAKQSRDAAT
jgi:hypothetical protein